MQFLPHPDLRPGARGFSMGYPDRFVGLQFDRLSNDVDNTEVSCEYVRCELFGRGLPANRLLDACEV